MTVTPAQLQDLASRVRQLQAYDRRHDGDPNGEVDAPRGARCADTSTGDIYRKTSVAGDLTGWVTP